MNTLIRRTFCWAAVIGIAAALGGKYIGGWNTSNASLFGGVIFALALAGVSEILFIINEIKEKIK